MRKLLTICRTTCLLLLCLVWSASMAQANATLISESGLRSQGITSRHFSLCCFSPDNKYLCGKAHEPRNRETQNFQNYVYIFPVAPDNTLGKPHIIPVDVPRFDQIAFTPDSKALVLITDVGARFLKIDVATGEVSTIMNHVKGQPGFRAYPAVLTVYDDELLVQGYFYDKDNYSGPNVIASLDYTKTGVDAFKFEYSLHNMQFQTRKDYLTFAETHPRKDIAFMGMNSGNDWTCYSWIANKGIKKFDKAQELLGFWGGGQRVIYTVKRENGRYDLVVYDALTDKKIMLSEGRSTPYMYVFLSHDGKTALFNDADDSNSTTQLLYAREDDGWKIKPISDLNKRIRTGTVRISDDGNKAAVHSKQGLRVLDIR